MSTYSELIKNFEKIRAYMREFYVYGFKSREEYDKKSARSYDDERRRMESWLGDHMSFVRTAEGKNMFISIDSRTSKQNPFYKAWKAKSFTDRDITVHFILFDILHSPEIGLTLPEIIEKMDGEYFEGFDEPMVCDASTVRKKLKEYSELGLITVEKQGKKTLYHRNGDLNLGDIGDALDFYSETAPCGVIGSFILDKMDATDKLFSFKHHYITGAMDSDVMAELFLAMRQKCSVTVDNYVRKTVKTQSVRIVPLRIFISVQGGRQHLLAYTPEFNSISSFRIDNLSNVRINEPTPRFDELRSKLDSMQTKMWGVTPARSCCEADKTEHVEFTVKLRQGEDYIIDRLNREKRCGKVECIDDQTYKFSADVCDVGEMVPWIRTFICRIEDIRFSNSMLDKKFRADLDEMYRMYGITEEVQL